MPSVKCAKFYFRRDFGNLRTSLLFKKHERIAQLARNEERFMALIALFAAILMASHSSFQESPAAVLGSYTYWICRIGVEALLFFAVRSVVETYAAGRLNFAWVTVLALAISHLPFVLSVTAIDIVLGLPEIGIVPGAPATSHIAATLWEAFFLADNHIALCLLLTVPRLVTIPRHATEAQAADTFLSTLDPPLKGDILWIEAQEHYVRITTAEESRLVLARFSDVVRELPGSEGMQVHRSHWIRKAAVTAQEREGQNLLLSLTNGSRVPVSRSYKQQVLQALAG